MEAADLRPSATAKPKREGQARPGAQPGAGATENPRVPGQPQPAHAQRAHLRGSEDAARDGSRAGPRDGACPEAGHAHRGGAEPEAIGRVPGPQASRGSTDGHARGTGSPFRAHWSAVSASKLASAPPEADQRLGVSPVIHGLLSPSKAAQELPSYPRSLC